MFDGLSPPLTLTLTLALPLTLTLTLTVPTLLESSAYSLVLEHVTT